MTHFLGRSRQGGKTTTLLTAALEQTGPVTIVTFSEREHDRLAHLLVKMIDKRIVTDQTVPQFCYLITPQDYHPGRRNEGPVYIDNADLLEEGIWDVAFRGREIAMVTYTPVPDEHDRKEES